MKIREAIQEMKGRGKDPSYSNMWAFTVMTLFCSGVALFFGSKGDGAAIMMAACYVIVSVMMFAAAIYHWMIFITILKQPKPHDMLEERKDEPAVQLPGKIMPQYQCHKKVWALKIKEIHGWRDGDNGIRMSFEEEGYADVTVQFGWWEKNAPQVGGYYVVYEDGYTSYSPAKAFEDGYALAASVSYKEAMVNKALTALRLEVDESIVNDIELKIKLLLSDYKVKAQYVSLDKDIIEPQRKVAIEFLNAFLKMSPRDKCTVHPPAGSGAGPGVYNKSMEDIFNEWFNSRIRPV